MSVPVDLRVRGKAIWLSFGADALPAGHRALVHEACRLADTLDKLDGLLGQREDAWLKILLDDLGEVTLVIDTLLSERRSQALAFKQIMTEIRMAGLKQTGGGPVAVDNETQGRDGLIRGLQQRAG